jgi:hypothetical protein
MLAKAPNKPNIDKIRIIPSADMKEASALIPPVIKRIAPITVLLTAT